MNFNRIQNILPISFKYTFPRIKSGSVCCKQLSTADKRYDVNNFGQRSTRVCSQKFRGKSRNKMSMTYAVYVCDADHLSLFNKVPVWFSTTYTVSADMVEQR